MSSYLESFVTFGMHFMQLLQAKQTHNMDKNVFKLISKTTELKWPGVTYVSSSWHTFPTFAPCVVNLSPAWTIRPTAQPDFVRFDGENSKERWVDVRTLRTVMVRVPSLALRTTNQHACHACHARHARSSLKNIEKLVYLQQLVLHWQGCRKTCLFWCWKVESRLKLMRKKRIFLMRILARFRLNFRSV